MAKNPVIIGTHMSPVENTRKFFQHEQTRKSANRFVFNQYQTDRERVTELLKEKRDNYKKSSQSTSSNFNRIESDEELPRERKGYSSLHNSQQDFNFIQPKMKFKHRTELERIYEAISNNSFGRENRDVIMKQLNNMDVYSIKRMLPKEEIQVYSFAKNISKKSKQARSTKKLKEAEKKLEILGDLKEVLRDEELKLLSSRMNNVFSKELMKDLHVKTHFKGLHEYVNKKPLSSLSTINLNKYSIYMLMVSSRSMDITTDRSANSYEEKQKFPLKIRSEIKSKFFKNSMFDECEDNFVSKNPSSSCHISQCYDVDFNPLDEQVEEKKSYPKSDLDYLKKLSESLSYKSFDLKSFQKIEKNEALKNLKLNKKINDKRYFSLDKEEQQNVLDSYISRKNKDEEERVMVGKETFLKSQIDLIAKKVLNNCNYLGNKSAFNNSSLHIGSGKVAVTSGLTVNEFAKKYRLPK
jgi:hypothetical protein